MIDNLQILPDALQREILYEQENGYKVSHVECFREDLSNVYMYDPYGLVVLIQYFNGKVNIVRATSKGISKLLSDMRIK